MIRTLAEILPLAVAAAFSPTGLLFVMMIISSRDTSRMRPFKFLAGAAIFLVILSLVVLLVWRPALSTIEHPQRASAAVDIVLGTMVALVVLKSVFFKSFLSPKKDRPHWQERKKPFFILGFAYMLTNISTIVPFIAACKIIADDGLAFWENIPLLVTVLVVTMSLVVFPVAIDYLMPERSEKILGPVKSFMSRHGGRIAYVYFFLIAIYLIGHGIVIG